MDIFWGKAGNRFHVGYSHQFNGQKNTVVKERKENYGLTKIEDGDFYWLFDLAIVRETFSAQAIALTPKFLI